MTITAAADGSALGNPGPAGWAWYVDDDHWASGGWPHGTNNMGELTAVLDLLRATAHLDEDLHVFCDSTYAINTITKWMAGWKRRGWRKGDGKPVMNVEIVQALDEAMTGRRVRFEWVKGHAGHPLNEAADRLANAAATAYRDGREPEPGPGFVGAPARPPVLVSRSASALEQDLLLDLDAELDSDDLPLTDEQRVVAWERALLTDEIRGDRAEVAALLHPAWTEIGRSGRLWTREEMLAAIRPLGEASFELISVERIAGEVILVLWRSHADHGSSLRSSVWVRDGGDWRQRFHQGTACD